MRAGRSLAQHPVGVFGDVFDLNTGHGAILALLAPKCKREPQESHQSLSGGLGSSAF